MSRPPCPSLTAQFHPNDCSYHTHNNDGYFIHAMGKFEVKATLAGGRLHLQNTTAMTMTQLFATRPEDSLDVVCSVCGSSCICLAYAEDNIRHAQSWDASENGNTTDLRASGLACTDRRDSDMRRNRMYGNMTR